MVRLVFRPYTQFLQSICTSELLRTSTRVSSGFVLTRHSSPSFGSQRMRSQVLAHGTWDKRRPGCPARPRCPDRQTASPRPAPCIHYQNERPTPARQTPEGDRLANAGRRRSPPTEPAQPQRPPQGTPPPRSRRRQATARDRPASKAHFHFASGFRKPLDSRTC